MEFKSQEKWRVQEKFSLTEDQLDLAIHRMIKRHPYEKWVQTRIAINDEKVVYLKLEFINWLEEVYLNKEKYYLDAEIDFFKKQIIRLENELNIPHKEFDYQDMTVRELCNYFDKSLHCIYKSIKKLRQSISIPKKYLDDGRLVVTSEGVKWLSECYFRKAYLKDLEFYKIELQNYKRKLYEQSIYK